MMCILTLNVFSGSLEEDSRDQILVRNIVRIVQRENPSIQVRSVTLSRTDGSAEARHDVYPPAVQEQSFEERGCTRIRRPQCIIFLVIFTVIFIGVLIAHFVGLYYF